MKPITVSINPSYFCNFRCDFCYLTSEQLGDQKDLADFEGKSWDDLYAADKLETVRTKFPDLYEKLRKEKYPNT